MEVTMKQNVLLTALVLFIGFQFTNAQSIIYGGPVEGQWTKNESPYIIRGFIYVEDKKTLEIEAGVHIIFESSIPMVVNGRLLAQGNDIDTILFTTHRPDVGWGGIRFQDILSGNEASMLSYCKFEHASAKGEWPFHSGGAIGIKYTNKINIENCLFEHNKALDNMSEGEAGRIASGGAIAIWLSEVRLSKNVFRYNEAVNGGAIFIDKYSKATIDNSLFYGNTAMNNGGAIAVSDNSVPRFINCTFADNYANNKGGAVSASHNSNPVFLNNIIWGNAALEDGNQLNVTAQSSFNLFHTNIEGGLAKISGNKYSESGHIYHDFNPEYTDKGSFPYMIEHSSPAIDLGSLNSLYMPKGYEHPATDIFGNRRISGSGIDIGFAEAERYPIDHSFEVLQANTASSEYSDWDVIDHTGLQSDFVAVHFVDDNHGWVVSSEGSVIYTTDRGLSWEEEYFGPSVHLTDVQFIDEYTGFVIGTMDIGPHTKGIAYKTNDGGQTWELSFITETSTIFASVDFIDSQNGIITGYSISPSGTNGIVLKTNDSGDNWEYVDLGIIVVKFDNASFNNENEGWIVGKMNVGPRVLPVIFESKDGGNTWNANHVDNAGVQFEDIHFYDAHHGVAVGDNGSVLSTSDAGKNWMAQNIGRLTFNAAIAGESQSAWIIGDEGLILSTNTNGKIWTQEYTLEDSDLNAICSTPGGFLWVVGDEGTIYMQKPIEIDGNPDDEQSIYSPEEMDLVSVDGAPSGINNHGSSIASHKNYPNPFTNQTTISFELNEAVNVSLRVFAINGQLIKILKDQILEAGVQQVEFDGSDLTPGIYTYILTTDRQVENGKMLIQ